MPDHAKTKIKLSDSFFELRGFKPVDVEKPTLTRDPVVLGSANVNSEFTLSLGLSEKISGMSRVSAVFRSVDGKTSFRAYKTTFASPKADEQTLNFKVPKSQKEGDYYLSYILLIDKNDNKSQYYCSLGNLKYKKTEIQCPIIELANKKS